ncbi:hypothetical protein GYMLUDRAFT_239427 [Collybiopsis luxurians FD-317 M1]|nr:hypothetical protein GYMLUDRAFT_239427 [Collybiopsis luxurians FD-317 M1]
MFDRSENAGVAGNSQWGLDVGMLEDNWNPYDLSAPEMERNERAVTQNPGPEYNWKEEKEWLETQT